MYTDYIIKHCRMATVLYLVAVIVMKTVISIDVEEAFPEIKGNLTKLTWAHAVNNASFFNSTLLDDSIMMLEADVQLGTLTGSKDVIPIMAHPPNNISDLSLEIFLRNVTEYNEKFNKTKKGAKLDFKTIEAFNASLDIIKKNKGKYPLWINADILPGPIDATTKPVDATQFFEGCKNMPDATLSVGWTTNYSNISGYYSDDHIKNMTTEIKKFNSSNSFTFPVRAGLAAESLEQMKNLLAAVPNSTLTIWSSEGDKVVVDHLKKLITTIGVQKSFIDVPDDLKSQLRLDVSPGGAQAVAVSLAMLICSILAILV